MNILIIGTGKVEQSLINLCLKSKLLNKIYTASFEPLEGIPNLEYFSTMDLVQKIKAIQADIILVADKNLIASGFVDEIKKHNCNIIGVNKKWYNLQSSRLATKQLLEYYSINTPQIIKAPVSFPLVLKTAEPYSTQIIESMKDLVEKRNALEERLTFLEEYYNGDILYLTSLWDGENLWHLPINESINEVQEDRLELYKTKLSFLLSDEKADFIGFFTTKLIWTKNDWHVLEYIMHINDKAPLNLIDKDFLYILNSAIYQKLNEL